MGLVLSILKRFCASCIVPSSSKRWLFQVDDNLDEGGHATNWDQRMSLYDHSLEVVERCTHITSSLKIWNYTSKMVATRQV